MYSLSADYVCYIHTCMCNDIELMIVLLLHVVMANEIIGKPRST